MYRGDTALHVAAAAHRTPLVRDLVAAGATVDATNRRGATPLHYAVDGGPGAPRWDPAAQADTVAALVALGADPDAADANGTPPLLRAVRNRCATAVEALLDGGADPHATNRKRLERDGPRVADDRPRRQRLTRGEGAAGADRRPAHRPRRPRS